MSAKLGATTAWYRSPGAPRPRARERTRSRSCGRPRGSAGRGRARAPRGASRRRGTRRSRVRSIRFRNCFGMIWSVSTSARSSTWILPSIFFTGSIDRLLRLRSAEDRQPGQLEVHVHLLEPDLAQPFALGLGVAQDVVVVRVVVGAHDLVGGPGFAPLLLGLQHALPEELVEQALGEPAGLDVLPVQEEAARREQVERLAVERALALVGQVVDRQARDDASKRSPAGQPVAPSRRATRSAAHDLPAALLGSQPLLAPRPASARRSRPARRSTPGRRPARAPRSRRRLRRGRRSAAIRRPPRVINRRTSSSCTSNSGISLRPLVDEPIDDAPAAARRRPVCSRRSRPLPDVHEVALDRGCGGHLRADQVGAPAAPLAPLEVAVRGRGAALARAAGCRGSSPGTSSSRPRATRTRRCLKTSSQALAAPPAPSPASSPARPSPAPCGRPSAPRTTVGGGAQVLDPEFVHDPMKTRSTGCPRSRSRARAPCRPAPARRPRGRPVPRARPGSGTRPVTGRHHARGSCPRSPAD